MRFSIKLVLSLCLLIAPGAGAGTYVTLEHVSIDRCASAWFIKRFIDPDAVFVFFAQGGKPPAGTGFGFFGAEYFNQGPDCTFTAWVKKNRKQDNQALQKMNAIVNDVMAWTKGSGFLSARLSNHIGELYDLTKSDAAVLEAIFPAFDLLYVKCGGARAGYQEPARKYYDRVELQVLRRLLNDQGKQRLDRLLSLDATVIATPDDRALAKVLDLDLSTVAAVPEKPSAAAVQVLNGTLSAVDASVIRWLRDAAREDVQTKKIDETFELAGQASMGELEKKLVLFEKTIWTTPQP